MPHGPCLHFLGAVGKGLLDGVDLVLDCLVHRPLGLGHADILVIAMTLCDIV